jgi:hypothetical protein
MCLRGENKSEIHFSSPCGSYSVSVSRFSGINKFLWVLKNIEFHLKAQRGIAFGFIENVWSRSKLAENSYFIPVMPIFFHPLRFLSKRFVRDEYYPKISISSS